MSETGTLRRIQDAAKMFEAGRAWLTANEAANLLSCEGSSLVTAAREKGSLGSLEFIWSGNFLKISTMSVIRFLAGGYPLQEIMREGY